MALYHNMNVPFVPQSCPAIAFMTHKNCFMRLDGKGSVFVQPDRASIVIGVYTENMQLNAAQSENAQKMANVIAAIMDLGIRREDIRTQTYQITPQYEFVDGEQVFRGYRVVNELNVEIENISNVGRIIDEAVRAGANTVGNISFHVSKMETHYETALNKAIENAIAKAGSVGRNINAYVNQIPVRIIEKTTGNAVPMPFTMQAVSGTTPIQPGMAEITAYVEAIFAYSCNM